MAPINMIFCAAEPNMVLCHPTFEDLFKNILIQNKNNIGVYHLRYSGELRLSSRCCIRHR